MTFDSPSSPMDLFQLSHEESSSNQQTPKKSQIRSASSFLSEIKKNPGQGVNRNALPATQKINHASNVSVATQLEFFPLHQAYQRVTANALSRSSLFTINARPKKGEPREVISKKSQIFSLKGCLIYFSGEVLDQYDYDVFMAILQLYNNNLKVNESVVITPLQLLTHAGMNSTKNDYIRLDQSLTRLVEANIHIEYTRREYIKNDAGVKTEDFVEHKVKVVGHLLSSFKRSELTSGNKRLLTINVDQEIIKMFTPGTYSSLNWDKHKQLSPMAKFLNHFYATHNNPFPYSVDIFKKLTGSRSNSMASFKQALAKSFQELVHHEIIKFYAIKDNNVHVIKE